MTYSMKLENWIWANNDCFAFLLILNSLLHLLKASDSGSSVLVDIIDWRDIFIKPRKSNEKVLSDTNLPGVKKHEEENA